MSTNTSTTNDLGCTVYTCPLSEALIAYRPSIGGNATFVALFGFLALVQALLSIRHKIWGYMGAMVLGLTLEFIGYIGRLQLNNDPFKYQYFDEIFVCLSIAPTFLTAAIYLTFARVVSSCDESLSWLRPKTMSTAFKASTIMCVILQIAGGATTSASTGPTEESTRQTGVDVTIVGLSILLVSLLLFILNGAIYAWNWRAATALHARHRLQSEEMRVQWRCLVFGLADAAVAIFIRTAFRIAELSGGFEGDLANNQAAFMILESTMVFIASVCLTIGHPGLCLDIAWKNLTWRTYLCREVHGNVESEGKAGVGLSDKGSQGPEV
ncbi:RTA1 like protein-domain-containing protein [Aspergillus karnatakaensis]|uniref:RTA1 domain-containing protein n=1 Tax=Aspergillus karnatakaensis TaxID=1810916 RepID=UPI003CCD841E